jgi:hypothetical protein
MYIDFMSALLKCKVAVDGSGGHLLEDAAFESGPVGWGPVDVGGSLQLQM